MGHRNPQGLEVDRTGRIWSTEHGPEGGDELNLIQTGGNYGWPLVTYGTLYGLDHWPISPNARDHGRFVEPVDVLVPSVGVSNLIQLRGDMFPNWKGDFLVGSLSDMILFRVRTRGDRLAFRESIDFGHKIRDLAEGTDGRLAIWTGRLGVVTVARAEESVGERAYAACVECHGPTLEGSDQGPSLRHLLQRYEVASRPGFDFSPAMRAVGGSWTEERLDEFLRDPQAFAPGTAMAFPGIQDGEVRRALITYLDSNR